jgi:hypothetical protein
MIGLESLRWVLTVAFGGTSVFHLVRCLRPAVRPEPVGAAWISETLHLLMGVSMLAMIWPAGDVVPAPVWVAVFTASTGWFVVRALRSAGRRLVLGFFATSMAIMVWIGASIPVPASAAHGSGTGTDPMAMDGMAMGGGRLGPAAWTSGLLGGYLLVAAFWWFFRGLRLGHLRTTADVAVRPLSWSSMCHGLMSIGMGLVLLAMV